MSVVFFLCAILIHASAQKNISMELYAGSNAPWGKNQSLTINANGECKYILTEVEKGVIDSSSFTISHAQLNELYNIVQESHFFKLDKIYNSGDVDGTGLYLKVELSGKSHEVRIINEQVKEVKLIIDKLNIIMDTYQVHINY